MHSRIDIRTCTSHFIMAIMGSLFLGDLLSAAAAGKRSARRALEACSCVDRAFGRARLGHCGIEARMPAVHTHVAPAGTRRPLSGGDPKLRRVVHLSSAQTSFQCPLIPWTAPWPAKVRGNFGQVSTGWAPGQCLNQRCATKVRMRTEHTKLAGTLVCRLMRRGSASVRHSHEAYGRRTGGRCWREEQQHGLIHRLRARVCGFAWVCIRL